MFAQTFLVCLPVCLISLSMCEELPATFPPTLLREIKVGDPKDPDNMLGALVSKEHMAKVKGYIDLARSEGCSIMCGDGIEQLNLPQQNSNVSIYIVIQPGSSCTHPFQTE